MAPSRGLLPMSHGYALYSLKPVFDAFGVPVADALRLAQLPEDLFRRRDARVSPAAYYALARAIDATVGDPLFVLKMIEGMGAEMFSPPLFAALCSPDLSIAATRLALFKPLLAPMRLRVEQVEQGLAATFEWIEDPRGVPPMLSGLEALALVKLARLGTRQRICPVRVSLVDPLPEQAAYEAFLGCEITFGSEVSVLFSSADATRPFLSADSSMWEIFEPHLRKRLADLEGSATYAARTRAVLLEALPSGQVTLHGVARRLAMSDRTLQRRLRAEDTSFQAVVQETRVALARRYLAREDLSVQEVAYLLGFQEANSFFRAFQRWTGTTPSAMRRSLLATG